MKTLQVLDSVRTQWDEWSDKGVRMVVPGTIVNVKTGHARSKVYDVQMSDTGYIEEVRPDQIV